MPLRADLLNPIAGENPSGANLRYDPVYDQIKEARRQDDVGPQGDWQRERKVADYRQVVDLTSKSIAERSKDLQLGVWLTEAILYREKFTGLLQGLDFLRGLLDQFWETFYPEIDEGDLEPRLVLLGWVGARLVDPVRFTPITAGTFSLNHFEESRRVGSEEDAASSDSRREAREAAVKEGKPTVEDFDREAAGTPIAQYEAMVASMEGCIESVKALGSLCDEKFGDDSPSFEPLKAALEESLRIVNQILQKRPGRKVAPEPEPEPEPEIVYAPDPVYEEQPVEDVVVETAQPRKAASITLEPEDQVDVARRLHAIAKYLREQDSSSPAPYLLLRGYRWGELRGYGDSPDVELLVPPPTIVRQTLRRLAAEFSWSELIEAVETAMAEPYGRAWLDLQRYTVHATEETGQARIASAVRSEVRTLIADLPRLPRWEFSDGTAVASVETHAWLEHLASPLPLQLPVTVAAPNAPPDPFKLALEAVRDGRGNQAIQMLASEIPRQQSGRGKFQTKLQLAQICMMTGHETLAQPLLEELLQSIDQHALDEWEPRETVAQPLVMLYKLQRDDAAKQKLYARISRLDPIQALECEK